MNIGALVFLVVAAFVTAPASAQSTGSATGPKTTSVSIDSILADGFEIKTISILSDTAIKEVFPKENLQSQLVLTLQKGSTLATCTVATVNWVNLTQATMTNPSICSKR